MILKSNPRKRRGATLVESAIVFPLVFLLLIAVFIGAMGIFAYLEVAELAQEGSRYASVHGKQYERDTGKTAATADEIRENAILPRVATLDTERLETTVTWDSSNEPSTPTTSYSVPRTNTVTVTVTYEWMPPHDSGWANYDEEFIHSTNGLLRQGALTITGTFYAANSEIKITGSNASNVDVIGAQYISRTLQAGGNGKFKVDWKADKTAKIRQFGLVE